jgi:hypothetical protein
MTPKNQYRSNVKAQFESEQAAKHLSGAIKLATEVGDNDSRARSPRRSSATRQSMSINRKAGYLLSAKWASRIILPNHPRTCGNDRGGFPAPLRRKNSQADLLGTLLDRAR